MGRKTKHVTSNAAGAQNAGGAPIIVGAPAGLHEEIALVREFIRRSRDLASEGRTLDELLHTLDGVSRASSRLANLLKTQRSLDDAPDLSDALAKAFDEVIREMGE